MARARRLAVLLGFLLVTGRPAAVSGGPSLPYSRMAARIAAALEPEPGEVAIVRHDPAVLGGLGHEVESALAARGVEVVLLAWGPVSDFKLRLAQAQIYVWLPGAAAVIESQRNLAALAAWLDGGGREIHFHWADGSRLRDGFEGEHTTELDRLYLEALDVDYRSLRAVQEQAVTLLRGGEIRVTTPAGTDLRFRTGGRPFTRQDGDASRLRTGAAPVPTAREIELPAGAVRVAPREETVEGRLVVPWARFGSTRAETVRFEIHRGDVTEVRAATGEQAVRQALQSEPALRHFRELGIGFNPALRPLPGSPVIPYYGYGAGVVRLSLGNNLELGGAVSGRGVRWFFFTDATVRVGDKVLVEAGRLRVP